MAFVCSSRGGGRRISKKLLDDPEVLRQLSRKLGSNSSHLKLVSETKVQSLWAGYGSLSRIEMIEVGEARAGKRGKDCERIIRLVVKEVDAPRGRGVSHERKIRCLPLVFVSGVLRMKIIFGQWR
jgi:hypothetical protein